MFLLEMFLIKKKFGKIQLKFVCLLSPFSVFHSYLKTFRFANGWRNHVTFKKQLEIIHLVFFCHSDPNE